MSVSTVLWSVNDIVVHANGGISDELDKMIESRPEVNTWQARFLGIGYLNSETSRR